MRIRIFRALNNTIQLYLGGVPRVLWLHKDMRGVIFTALGLEHRLGVDEMESRRIFCVGRSIVGAFAWTSSFAHWRRRSVGAIRIVTTLVNIHGLDIQRNTSDVVALLSLITSHWRLVIKLTSVVRPALGDKFRQNLDFLIFHVVFDAQQARLVLFNSSNFDTRELTANILDIGMKLADAARSLICDVIVPRSWINVGLAHTTCKSLFLTNENRIITLVVRFPFSQSCVILVKAGSFHATRLILSNVLISFVLFGASQLGGNLDRVNLPLFLHVWNMVFAEVASGS